MKIVRFFCSKLHGFLDIDITFNNDLNFITGINGVGKTAILKTIKAITAPIPDFHYLSNLDFSNIIVYLEKDKNKYKIECKLDNSIKKLNIKNITKEIDDNPVLVDEKVWINIPKSDSFEEAEYKFKRSEFYKIIPKEFSCLFLDLKRNMIENKLGQDFNEFQDNFLIRRYFSSKVDLSHNEIKNAIENKIKILNNEVENLQRDLYSGILEICFEFMTVNDNLQISDNKNDIDELIKSKTDVIRTIENIERRFNIKNIKGKINDFFDKLSDMNINKKEDEKLLLLILNSRQLEITKKIIKKIEGNNKGIEGVKRPITQFIDTINSFFKYTGKRINVTSTGKIFATYADSKRKININELSSGEQQVITIVSHIIFREKNNSLILIDEPELSLHVHWQDMLRKFFENFRENKTVQLILATHSPELIYNLEDKCIPLSCSAKDDNK